MTEFDWPTVRTSLRYSSYAKVTLLLLLSRPLLSRQAQAGNFPSRSGDQVDRKVHSLPDRYVGCRTAGKRHRGRPMYSLSSWLRTESRAIRPFLSPHVQPFSDGHVSNFRRLTPCRTTFPRTPPTWVAPSSKAGEVCLSCLQPEKRQ